MVPFVDEVKNSVFVDRSTTASDQPACESYASDGPCCVLPTVSALCGSVKPPSESRRVKITSAPDDENSAVPA